MSTMAERLKSAREHAQITQQQLADRSGVSQGVIGQIESGRNKTSKYTARLAHALNVTAIWLDQGKGPRRHDDAALPVAEEIAGVDRLMRDSIINVLARLKEVSANPTPERVADAILMLHQMSLPKACVQKDALEKIVALIA